jgi:hypothetical protein
MFDVYMDDMRQIPGGWVGARTIEETQSLLESGRVRLLSLDHDMGACDECLTKGEHVGDMATPETTFMNWCPHAGDGSSLVRWMIEHNQWSSEKPTVHSANPVGRERMRGLIDRYWPECKPHV